MGMNSDGSLTLLRLYNWERIWEKNGHNTEDDEGLNLWNQDCEAEALRAELKAYGLKNVRARID